MASSQDNPQPKRRRQDKLVASGMAALVSAALLAGLWRLTSPAREDSPAPTPSAQSSAGNPAETIAAQDATGAQSLLARRRAEAAARIPLAAVPPPASGGGWAPLALLPAPAPTGAGVPPVSLAPVPPPVRLAAVSPGAPPAIAPARIAPAQVPPAPSPAVVRLAGETPAPAVPPPVQLAAAPSAPSVAPAFLPQVPSPQPQASPAPVSLSAPSTKPVNVALATLKKQAPSEEDLLGPPEIRPKLKFVTSLCLDQQSNIWIGTEENGLFRYSPGAPEKEQWKQFTDRDGLGDNWVYALASDHKGRVWGGHLNHGVSVYNGQKWQCYEVVGGLSRPDTLSGPIGERVFRIAVCPTDGDVWMATDLGLARYSETKDTWAYYTRAQGLPSDQANGIAFDKDGDIYVATQCDGLAIASAKDDYKTWRTVAASEEEPAIPSGDGLPTNLLNDVLCTNSGSVYVATDAGLAWSEDKGKSWRFIRGKDWTAKVRGRLHGPPDGWTERPLPTASLLEEDRCMCLCEESGGCLWVGHWQAGYERLDERTLAQTRNSNVRMYASAIVADRQTILVAADASGVVQDGGSPKPGLPAAPRNGGPSPLPSPAAPPTGDEVSSDLAAIRMRSGTSTAVAYIGEDWATQGDWVGRYGRRYALLCAMNSPNGDHCLVHGPACRASGDIGPHHAKGDSLRHWISKVQADDHRALYDPVIGIRRLAEFDDHGEAYSRSFEGPDLSVLVEVPDGMHRLSLYFTHRLRDYVLEVSPVGRDPTAGARCRVQAFQQGVYKEFVVSGPGQYRVRVAKNGSLNAVLSGLFLDLLNGPAAPADRTTLPWLADVPYGPPVPVAAGNAEGERIVLPRQLWAAAAGPTRPDQAVWSRAAQLAAYRAALAAPANAAPPAEWRWELRLWQAEDRKEFAATMARGSWQRMQEFNPHLRSKKWRPYSPGTADEPDLELN